MHGLHNSEQFRHAGILDDDFQGANLGDDSDSGAGEAADESPTGRHQGPAGQAELWSDDEAPELGKHWTTSMDMLHLRRHALP
jgi:hypothetical protein